MQILYWTNRIPLWHPLSPPIHISYLILIISWCISFLDPPSPGLSESMAFLLKGSSRGGDHANDCGKHWKERKGRSWWGGEHIYIYIYMNSVAHAVGHPTSNRSRPEKKQWMHSAGEIDPRHIYIYIYSYINIFIIYIYIYIHIYSGRRRPGRLGWVAGPGSRGRAGWLAGAGWPGRVAGWPVLAGPGQVASPGGPSPSVPLKKSPYAIYCGTTKNLTPILYFSKPLKNNTFPKSPNFQNH